MNETLERRLKAKEELIAELLLELTVSIERGVTLGYLCEDQLDLYKRITGEEYEYEGE